MTGTAGLSAVAMETWTNIPGPDAPHGVFGPDAGGEGPAAGVRRGGDAQHAAGELLPGVGGGGDDHRLAGLDARELRLLHRHRDLHRVRDEGGDGGLGADEGPDGGAAGRDDPVRGGGDEGVVALGAGDVQRRLGLLDGGLGGGDVLGGERVLAQGQLGLGAPHLGLGGGGLAVRGRGLGLGAAALGAQGVGLGPRRAGLGLGGLGLGGGAFRLGLGGAGRLLGLLHVVGAGAGHLGLLGLGLLDPFLRLLQVEGDLLPAGRPAAAGPAPR